MQKRRQYWHIKGVEAQFASADKGMSISAAGT